MNYKDSTGKEKNFPCWEDGITQPHGNSVEKTATDNNGSIMERLLTVTDIQHVFDIGRTQAYALIRSSDFPTIRLNNRLYVQRKALDAWLEGYKGRRFMY